MFRLIALQLMGCDAMRTHRHTPKQVQLNFGIGGGPFEPVFNGKPRIMHCPYQAGMTGADVKKCIRDMVGEQKWEAKKYGGIDLSWISGGKIIPHFGSATKVPDVPGEFAVAFWHRPKQRRSPA